MMQLAYDDIIHQNLAKSQEVSGTARNMKNFLDVYKSDIPNTKKDN